MKVMPEIPSDEDAFVYADPRQSALDYAAANIDKSIDNLRDLCKIQPRDIDGAVSKVACIFMLGSTVKIELAIHSISTNYSSLRIK